jgi:hypothetical protein
MTNSDEYFAMGLQVSLKRHADKTMHTSPRDYIVKETNWQDNVYFANVYSILRRDFRLVKETNWQDDDHYAKGLLGKEAI